MGQGDKRHDGGVAFHFFHCHLGYSFIIYERSVLFRTVCQAPRRQRATAVPACSPRSSPSGGKETDMACVLAEAAMPSLLFAIYVLLHHRRKRGCRTASPSLFLKKKSIAALSLRKTQTPLGMNSPLLFMKRYFFFLLIIKERWFLF